MAMLSLAGNHAATLGPDAVGHTVHYASRGLAGERLGPAFAYDVLAVFGDGSSGRAVAFRPHHSAASVCIAFRGVRVQPPGPERQPKAARHPAPPGGLASGPPGAAPAARNAAAGADRDDLAALLDLNDCHTAWAQSKVHHGIQTHQEAIWSRAGTTETAEEGRREVVGDDCGERCDGRDGERRGERRELRLSHAPGRVQVGVVGVADTSAHAGSPSPPSDPAPQLPGHTSLVRALPSAERQLSSEPCGVSARTPLGLSPKRKLPFSTDVPSVSSLVADFPSPSVPSVVAELSSPPVSPLMAELPPPFVSSLVSDHSHVYVSSRRAEREPAPQPQPQPLCPPPRRMLPPLHPRDKPAPSPHSAPYRHIDLDRRSSSGDSVSSHQRSSCGDLASSHRRSSSGDSVCSRDSVCSQQHTSRREDARAARRSPTALERAAAGSGVLRGDGGGGGVAASTGAPAAGGFAVEGLGEWLHRHGGSLDRILFVGLSLGASLAQLSALRVASEPRLASLLPRLHVLAMGAARWADAPAADRFRLSLGDRAVHLINSMVVPPPLPKAAFWWMAEGLLVGGSGGAGGEAGGGVGEPTAEEDAIHDTTHNAQFNWHHNRFLDMAGETAGGNDEGAGPCEMAEEDGDGVGDGAGAGVCGVGVEDGTMEGEGGIGAGGVASTSQCCSGCVMVDPLTAAFSPSHALLHNVVLCHQIHAPGHADFRSHADSPSAHEHATFPGHAGLPATPGHSDFPRHAYPLAAPGTFIHASGHVEQPRHASPPAAPEHAQQPSAWGHARLLYPPRTLIYIEGHGDLCTTEAHAEPPAAPGYLTPLAALGPLARGVCGEDGQPPCDSLSAHGGGTGRECSAIGSPCGGGNDSGGSAGECDVDSVRARERAFGTESIALGPVPFEAVADMQAQPGALAALMQGRLPLRHPMADAYLALHLGRKYRAAFVGLYLARCAKGGSGASVFGGNDVATGGVNGFSPGGVNGVSAMDVNGVSAEGVGGWAADFTAAVVAAACPARASQSPPTTMGVIPRAPPARAPVPHASLRAPHATAPLRLLNHSTFAPPHAPMHFSAASPFARPLGGSPCHPRPAGSLKRPAPDPTASCNEEAPPDTPQWRANGALGAPAGSAGGTHGPSDDRRHALGRARGGRTAVGRCGGMARAASSCASLCELTSMVEVASYSSVNELGMV